MLKKNIIIFMSFALILIGRSEPKNTFSESHLNEIDLEINKAIKESKIPGAVLWIEKDNNLYRDLKEKYKSIINLEIYNDDILNFKFQF